MARLRTFVPPVAILAAIAVNSTQPISSAQQPLVLTHGIASGDVTATSAII